MDIIYAGSSYPRVGPIGQPPPSVGPGRVLPDRKGKVKNPGIPGGGSSANPNGIPVGDHMSLMDKSNKMNTDINSSFMGMMPFMKGPTVTKKDGTTVTLDLQAASIKNQGKI